MGIDQNSFTPCIATAEGVVSRIAPQLGMTHVVTNDINDINYVSESFIRRYTFKFEKKHSGLFGSILTGLAIAVGVVALVAATIFTCGAAGAVAAGTAASIGGAISAGALAVAAAAGVAAATVGIGAGVSFAAASAIMAGAVVAGTALTIATLGAIQEVRYGIGRMFAKCSLNGRATQCPSGYRIVETDDSRQLT